MELQVKDLRIGNTVLIDDKITSLTAPELFYLWDFGIDEYKCESIPLTEEWLVKFGFEKESAWMINIGDEAFIWYDIDDKTIAIGVPYEASGNGKELLYVHQLQNLYFALTGEELTIKD